MTWLIGLVLAAVGVVLFVVPHHHGSEISRAKSLALDMAELMSGEPVSSSRALLIQLLIAIGCISVLLPACLLIIAKLGGPERSRAVLILGGITLILAGTLTGLVEIISNMTFGFGASGRRFQPTVIAYVAPLWPIVCGLVAIVAGAWRWRVL